MIEFIQKTREAYEKRKRYNRVVAEVSALTDRDLADIGGDRDEILRHIWLDFYGK